MAKRTKDTSSFDMYFVIVLTSMGIAYFVCQGNVICFVAAAIAIFLLLYLSLRSFMHICWKAQQKDAAWVESEELRVGVPQIKKLPCAEAKIKALEVLQDDEKFLCVKDDAGLDAIEDWSGTLKDFFLVFHSVAVQNADSQISRDFIGGSEISADYIRIGITLEHCELAFRPGEDTIYIIEGSGDSPEELDSFSSIYHWILYEKATVYD